MYEKEKNEILLKIMPYLNLQNEINKKRSKFVLSNGKNIKDLYKNNKILKLEFNFPISKEKCIEHCVQTIIECFEQYEYVLIYIGYGKKQKMEEKVYLMLKKINTSLFKGVQLTKDGNETLAKDIELNEIYNFIAKQALTENEIYFEALKFVKHNYNKRSLSNIANLDNNIEHRKETLRKKELVIHDPVIKTYLGDAFCFSILGNEVYQNGWLFDKYIDIEYRDDHQMMKHAYYDYYDFLPQEGVMIKKYHIIPIQNNKNIICDLVEQTINMEEYFFCFWNKNIITNYLYKENEKGFLFHGCFVYGYNRDKMEFAVQEYLNGKFTTFSIPYNVFMEAAIVGEHIENCFTYRSYSKSPFVEWNVDINKMIRGLLQYGDKQKSYDKISYYNIYGCKKFLSHLKSLETRKIDFHLPSIFCIYEHKTIMLQRLKFLYDLRLMSNKIVENFMDIVDSYKMMLNLAIKYNITFDPVISKDIICTFAENLDREEKVMEEIALYLFRMNQI